MVCVISCRTKHNTIFWLLQCVCDLIWRMLCHWWSIVPSIITQMTTQTKSAACRFFIQVIRLMDSVLLTSVLLLIMTCLHVKKHWLFMSTWQPGRVAFISSPMVWTINSVMTVNGNEASAGVKCWIHLWFSLQPSAFSHVIKPCVIFHTATSDLLINFSLGILFSCYCYSSKSMTWWS